MYSERDLANQVIGKRFMLWNIQRQLKGAKSKGKVINEEWLVNILKTLGRGQEFEEVNFEVDKYIESAIDSDMIQDSKCMFQTLE